MGLYGYDAPQIPTPMGLGFGAAIKEVFSKYGVFRGRATRSEYWWWQLFAFLVTYLPLIVGLIMALIAGARADTYGTNETGLALLGGILILISILSGLAILIPGLAVSVRRLHDMDLSGLVFLIVLVPTIGGVILFVMMLMPSKPHPNEYGMAPATRY